MEGYWVLLFTISTWSRREFILLVSAYVPEDGLFFSACSRVFDYLDIWSTIFGPTHELQTRS